MQLMSYCNIKVMRKCTVDLKLFVSTIKNRQCLPVQEYCSINVADVWQALDWGCFQSDCVVQIMISIGCPLGIQDPKVFGTLFQFRGFESSAVMPGLYILCLLPYSLLEALFSYDFMITAQPSICYAFVSLVSRNLCVTQASGYWLGCCKPSYLTH